jgi:hypothetical protein
MNPMFWPTALLAVLLFWLGTVAERCIVLPATRKVFLVLAAAIAAPGLLYVLYYTKLLGQPSWFFELRSWRYTELAGAGVGLLFGYIHHCRHKHPSLRRQLRRGTMPAIFAVVIAVPFLKPVVRPVDFRQMQDRWEGDVCLQSTPSTCGPASAATILRSLGKDVTEVELARECFTYAGGTEIWYLARSLRKRGCSVEFKTMDLGDAALLLPAVAGVRLREGTGHFIALLRNDGTNFIGNDPLTGKFKATLSELQTDYRFTGSFLLIK